MDFVAIDFETANGQPSSACQLAAVVVRDSEIVEEHSWLIRPPRMYFAPMNIRVHGIRPKDVSEAPTMDAVWSDLCGIIDGRVLVAHNARFDLGVLVHSLAAFDIACPTIEFTCTRALARAAWPGKSSYGLKPLGNWLGINFKHHDALEDSRCCAQIALAVANAYSEHELQTLEKVLRISRGHYRHSKIVGPRMLGRKGRSASASTGGARGSTDRWGFPSKPLRRSAGAIDPDAVVTAANNELPLAGKHIVMLGPLRGLDLQQTLELISRLGASAQTAISTSTDYVVACGTTLEDASQQVCISLANETSVGEEATPGQQSSGSESASSGQPKSTPKTAGIRLLSERQFLALLPAGKASVGW